jgi:hypothetical protein
MRGEQATPAHNAALKESDLVKVCSNALFVDTVLMPTSMEFKTFTRGLWSTSLRMGSA